jgi:ASCH domain
VKAISIQQPWAWLIAHGYKDVENRSWNTKFRGGFLVHASGTRLKHEEKIRALVWEQFHIELPHDFERGGIVGEAEIYDVTTAPGSAWFLGPFGFLIRNARPLEFRPLRGQLSWFEVDWPPPQTLPGS